MLEGSSCVGEGGCLMTCSVTWSWWLCLWLGLGVDRSCGEAAGGCVGGNT